jgi:hypothetical protein
MKISADWIEIAAFFVVSFVVFAIIAVAFVLALPSKALYFAARPLQALLDRLSRPRSAL